MQSSLSSYPHHRTSTYLNPGDSSLQPRFHTPSIQVSHSVSPDLGRTEPRLNAKHLLGDSKHDVDGSKHALGDAKPDV